jgi:hypothetical protein
MSRMTVEEATKRLADLAIEIERHTTAIWLAEREREEVRSDLRRALHASGESLRDPTPQTSAA